MILNNINNLIIIAESAAGDALLDGVKHGVKQFGRGLTDIVHLGKFNALDTAKFNAKNARARILNNASLLKINELHAVSKEAEKNAEHFTAKAKDAANKNRRNKQYLYMDRSDDEAKKAKLASRAADELTQHRKNLIQGISTYNKTAKELETQLELPTGIDGKLARAAGRATTGIAATGGTVAGINAATDKLAASNNKEESK